MDKKNNIEHLRIDRFKYIDITKQRIVREQIEKDITDTVAKNNYHFFTLVTTSSALSKLYVQESSILRFLEILNILSVSIGDFFEEYSVLYSTDFTLEHEEIKKILLHDIPRSKNAGKSLEPFIDSLVSYFDNHTEETNEKPSYIQNSIFRFLATPHRIIYEYEKYKEYICFFYDEIKRELNTENNERFFAIQYLNEYQVYASLLWEEVIYDITTDQIPSHSEIGSVPDNITETVCKKLLSTYITENSLPLANMLRANWDIIHKIYENKQLQNYLFELLSNNDRDNMTLEDSVLDAIYASAPLSLLQKSMNYAYLLNYSYLDSPVHTLNSTEKFFTKKISEDCDFSFFVFSKFNFWFLITPTIIQMLYYYACACL